MGKKRLLAALEGNASDRPPFWYMRQAGRYLPEYREIRTRCKNFFDLCFNPELAAEVTLQPIRRFGMDAAILFSDILVVPKALGAEVWFEEGEGPKLTPVDTREKLQQLSTARMEATIRPVMETLRRVRAELAPEKTLIGFAGSPWTVACYMIEGGGSKDFGKVLAFSHRERALFSDLIDLLTGATILYLKEQIKAGAEVIQLFDSWAGIVPQMEFGHWVINPTKHIIAALKKDHPHIPIIGFPRMAGYRYTEYASIPGLNGMSVDHATDMKALLPARITLQGNLDPYALAHDLPRALEYSKRLVENFRSIPFIFNLGHGMLPQTPVENVQALSDYLKSA